MAKNKIGFGKILPKLLAILAFIVIAYFLLRHYDFSRSFSELVLVELLLGVLIIEGLGLLLVYHLSKNINVLEAKTLRDLFRILSYVVLLLYILYTLNISITGLLASAGFLGIVVGLAAQTTLSNFIAGVYLLSSKAFEPDDQVTINTWQYGMQPQSYPHDKFVPGFSGIIENIGLLYTTLRNEENVPILVPNSIVVQAMVINYRRTRNIKNSEELAKIQFDMDYSVSFEKMKKVIDELLKKDTRVISYEMHIEYLHSQLYVITLHLHVKEGVNRRILRTDIFTEIIEKKSRMAAKP